MLLEVSSITIESGLFAHNWSQFRKFAKGNVEDLMEFCRFTLEKSENIVGADSAIWFRSDDDKWWEAAGKAKFYSIDNCFKEMLFWEGKFVVFGDWH